MDDDAIRSPQELLSFLEAEAVCLPGVRLCDVDLVSGALRILMSDGRRFELNAVEVRDDD